MDRLTPIAFGFNGGYQTDLPSQARQLSYFLKAENCTFEVSGAVRKVGGAAAINSSAIASTPDIVGMFDYWKAGVAGTWAQDFVAVTANSKIYKEDMDGTFDDVTGAVTITADIVPVFCQARDTLLILTSAADAPVKYDQTGSAAALGGTPPSGTGAVFHANRVWIWGKQANPSTIYYCSYKDIEDWSGVDTGAIDIDIDDGDVIIGAASFKNNLIIFKGPNKGSIHVISGTGPSSFSKHLLVRGIPLQAHNSIVEVGNDLLFMSNHGIHALSAVQQFGDYAPSDLTRYLKLHFRENVNRSKLNKVWGVNYAEKNCVLWTYTSASGSENDATLGLSYVRLQEEGWKAFTWTRGGISAATRIHPTTKLREVVYGNTAGVALREDVSDRSLPSNTAYSMRLQTPYLLLGQGKPDQPINVNNIYLRSVAKGNWNVNVSVTRDQNTSETYNFNQGVAGFLLDTDVLDVDALGATQMQIAYPNNALVAGSARAVQFDITQGGLLQDAEILEIGIESDNVAASRQSALVE